MASPGPSFMVRIAKSALRITAAAFIGATLMLVFLEKSFIYYPSREIAISPMQMGLRADEIALDVDPGVRIHGWVIPAETQPALATVLFSHGNAGNIGDRVHRAITMRRLGLDVVLYDYRGFGESTGAPDEEGTYRDARAVYDHLVTKRGVDSSKVVLMGESLGCAVTIQLALDRKAAGVALEAPFASIAHMASVAFPFLPLTPFVRTKYDNLEKIPRIGKPLLVLHGNADEVVPFRQGEMVFAAAREPKKFVRLDGAHHNDAYIVGGDGYARELLGFIRGVVGADPSPRNKE